MTPITQPASHPGASCRGLLTTLVILLATGAASAQQKKESLPREVAPEVTQLALLPKDDFKECSGLVVSRQFPGVLWTHNDGQDRRLFAFNRTGEKLAEFEVHGVFIWDWEDLASDATNRLYVADIGNNLEARPSLSVHRVVEPDPKSTHRGLAVDQTWVLKFPGKSFDSEGLVIWQDHGYLVEKSGKAKKAGLFRWPLANAGTVTLEKLGNLEITSPVTAADLSPDGTRLGLTADDGVYAIRFAAGPEHALGQKPFKVPFKLGQIEGCSFDHDGLLVISEGRELFLFTAEPFRLGASR